MTHKHEFAPPANDDEQQCDADCRWNWHLCKTCGKSRTQLANEAVVRDGICRHCGDKIRLTDGLSWEHTTYYGTWCKVCAEPVEPTPSELTIKDVPVMIESAKLACGYCGNGKPLWWPSDDFHVEFFQRPVRADDAGNYHHASGCYCKVYMLWQKIEELENAVNQ